jgi:translation elongation factor EF-Tu-like GTPase
MENLNNDLNQVQELKQELKENPLVSINNSEENTTNELYDLLNKTEVKQMDTPIVENKQVKSIKKNEEELIKMNLTQLKALAKKKNIPLMQSNKPKRKDTLIQEILNA